MAVPNSDSESSQGSPHLPSSSHTNLNENFYLRNLSGSRVASYPPTIPSNANGASLSVENVNISNDDTKISSILQIFPSKSRDDVAEILKASSSLEEATKRILNCSYAETILNERGALQKNCKNCFPLSCTFTFIQQV